MKQVGESFSCPACGLILDPSEPPPGSDASVPRLTLADTGRTSWTPQLPGLAKKSVLPAAMLAAGLLIGAFAAHRLADQAPASPPTARAVDMRPLGISPLTGALEGDIVSALSWPYHGAPLSRAASANATSLLLIGNRTSPAAGAGSAKYDLVDFDFSGHMRTVSPLVPAASGKVVAFAGEAGGDILLGVQQKAGLSILRQSASGELVWRHNRPADADAGFKPILHLLDDTALLFTASEQAGHMDAILIGPDGYPDWQRRLPMGDGAGLFSQQTIFDEIVVARTGVADGAAELRVSAVDKFGQVTFELSQPVETGERIMAMASARDGAVHVVTGPESPRLFSIDPLGLRIDSASLAAGAMPTGATDCVLDAHGAAPILTCATETELRTVPILAQDGMDAEIRSARFTQPAAAARLFGTGSGVFLLWQGDAAEGSLVASLSPHEAAPEFAASPPPGAVDLSDLAEGRAEPLPEEVELAAMPAETAGESEAPPAQEPAAAEPVAEPPPETPTVPATEAPEARSEPQGLNAICRVVCAPPGAPGAAYPVEVRRSAPAGRTLADIEAEVAGTRSGICANSHGTPREGTAVICETR